MPITFGRVVHPPFRDRLIPDSATHAWDDLGQRNPVGVCMHTMVGTLWGTDAYFRLRRARPDRLRHRRQHRRPEWDGVILRWNDPRGRRSGWANGGSDGLEGDGPLFVRTLGINAINRDLVSIERSDGRDITTPLSPKQFESLCQLTAYWFDQARSHGTDFRSTRTSAPGSSPTSCTRSSRPRAARGRRSRIGSTRSRTASAPSSKRPRPMMPVRRHPATSPPKPDHDWWPQGYAVDALTERFGGLTRHAAGRQDPAHGVRSARRDQQRLGRPRRGRATDRPPTPCRARLVEPPDRQRRPDST